MYQQLQQRLHALQSRQLATYLSQAKTGLEKESLRVTPQGYIAQSEHSKSLGSALTHPWITTDYSEALIELITPPQARSTHATDYLYDLQTFVYQHLGDELLWSSSMPCVMRGEDDVRIAEYGSSNAGQMKHVYRHGLAHRYGKIMQVIAGIHYNYSIDERFWEVWYSLDPQGESSLRAFRDQRYIEMIRNVQRYGWLIIYLFGASPAICKSFLNGRNASVEFKTYREHTLYEPYGTSLRMGNIGYTNSTEHARGVKVCYNSLSTYIASLRRAINTPNADYAAIGVKVNGVYRQLNANILQIENEYYSTVRPKQPLNGFEKPTTALERRGIGYVELRSLDLNPFDATCLTSNQMYFIEIFLHFCLLQVSPPISADEHLQLSANQLAVAHRGRDPKLRLQLNHDALLFSSWTHELLDAMKGVAELLDTAHGGGQAYQQALAEHHQLVIHPELTPSALVLEQIFKGGSFFEFAYEQSQHHKTHFLNRKLDQGISDMLTNLAKQSLEQQIRLETENSVAFDEFLAHYLNETLDSTL